MASLFHEGNHRVAAGLIAGGGLVIAGALLPWLTLFAGLQRYPGTTGLYGRLILAGGSVAVLGGLCTLRTRRPWLGRAGAALGAGLFLFGLWLVAGLFQTIAHGTGPMLVPRPGPGLFVVLAGAGLLAITPILDRVAGRRSH